MPLEGESLEGVPQVREVPGVVGMVVLALPVGLVVLVWFAVQEGQTELAVQGARTLVELVGDRPQHP